MQIVDLIIKNGTIVTSRGRFRAGIAVDEGRIVLVGSESHLPDADSVIDAEGKCVLPGVIDAHVHFRDPGNPEREDFANGTAAAASGGVTTVLDMPGTVPAVLSADVFQEKVESIRDKAYVDFGLYGGATAENLEDLEGLAQAGAVAFKTYMPKGTSYSASDDVSLFRVFEKLASTSLRCSVHAENGAIIEYLAQKLLAEGRRDIMVHAESRPNFVEAEAISKAIVFANAVKAKVHIAHTSSSEGVQILQSAKAIGQKVTSESCPQYLLLTADDFRKEGPYAKIQPPLRSTTDVEALWEGLRNGIIDIVASDHAPYTKAEKEPGFTDLFKARSGMPGVETMLPLMLTKVNEGELSLERLVEAMSESVSRIFGLYPRKGKIEIGSDADFTIVDMGCEESIKAADLHTKWPESIVYDGWKVKGVPTATIVRGELVMREGQIVGKLGSGKLVRPGH